MDAEVCIVIGLVTNSNEKIYETDVDFSRVFTTARDVGRRISCACPTPLPLGSFEMCLRARFSAFGVFGFLEVYSLFWFCLVHLYGSCPFFLQCELFRLVVGAVFIVDVEV